MGRVTVNAKVENLKDLWFAEEGHIETADIRSKVFDDALVDTGTTFLSLPRSAIVELGLRQISTRTANTPVGVREVPIYESVRLSVQGRFCHIDVAEVADNCPALIGQLPLEHMDFVVDPVGQQLIGNPAHGGEQMIDLF